MAATLWFYVRDDKRQGPVDFEHLVTMLLAGQIPHDALVWHQGLGDWAAAEGVPEIAAQLPPRPSPPPSSAPASASPSVAAAGSPRVDELRKRLEKDPESRLFAQLAEELRKEGQLEEAVAICRAGLLKHPSYPSARITLAHALLDGGDAAAARVELEGVVQGAPDNILARKLLDQCLATLGPQAAVAPPATLPQAATPPVAAVSPQPPAAVTAPDLTGLLDEEEAAATPRILEPSLIPPTGSLADIDFPDLVHGLHDRRWTGTIELNRGRVDSTVTVQGGRLSFATSTNPDERLGELLLRKEKITLRQYYEAGKAIRKGKRLGTLLVAQGALDARDLVQAVVDHTQEVIYSVFHWTEGFYRLREGLEGDAETITLKLSTANIILEGIGRITAWSRIERGIGGPAARYVRADDYKDRLAEMTLTPEKLLLLAGLEGERDVDTLCRESELSDFEVCRTIWAFRVIGVLKQVTPPGPQPS